MISIVTITFNNFDELVATLGSLKGVQDIQSIVINGGSCPRTLQFLASYPGIILSEKDSGISDAFNKGVRLATGDAVMFLNSGDILVDPGYIDWMNVVFKSEADIDFTYSGIVFKDPDLGEHPIMPDKAQTRSLAYGIPYPHQSLVMRRTLFERIGPFREDLRFCMDFDLVLKMKKTQGRGRYYPKPTVLMDGSGVSSKNDFAVLGEVFKVLRQNGFLSPLIIVRLIGSFFTAALKRLLGLLGLKDALLWIKKNRHRLRV